MDEISARDVELVGRMLRAYGVPHLAVRAPQKGYRNRSFPIELIDGGLANIILYKREPGILQRIQNAHVVADYLAGQSFPVRRTLDPRIMKLQAGSQVGYGALYYYLPGQTIPWEAYTQQHIKSLGNAMGQMHALLAASTQGNLPDVSDECQEALRRMRGYFARPGVQRAMKQKLSLQIVADLAGYRSILGADRHARVRHPLHMDFVRGNVLFDGGDIVGVLDFEKVAFGSPLFDIARTLAFLLVDCKYKSEQKVRSYFIRSGYEQRCARPISRITLRRGNERVDMLEALVDFFLLHDFYKFLRHNPYESLTQNEHFVRTRDLLLRRGQLQALDTSEHQLLK